MAEVREPTIIQRARAKHAGAEPPDEAPTPPPPAIPQREVRQQRKLRGAQDEDIELRAKDIVAQKAPHWALTLADLKQQRELLDTAITAIEALYR